VNKQHVKEKDEIIGRYHFLAVFKSDGHRNGYLGIPEAEFNSLVSSGLDMESIPVHGGITYEGGTLSLMGKPGFNYLGFDCSHYNDRPDIQSVIQYGFDITDAKMREAFLEDDAGNIRTLEYVEDNIWTILSAIRDPEEIIASYCVEKHGFSLYISWLTGELREEDAPHDLVVYIKLNNMTY
jgi:hypothetical protein